VSLDMANTDTEKYHQMIGGYRTAVQVYPTADNCSCMK